MYSLNGLLPWYAYFDEIWAVGIVVKIAFVCRILTIGSCGFKEGGRVKWRIRYCGFSLILYTAINTVLIMGMK